MRREGERDEGGELITIYLDEAKVFYTWQHAFNYSSPPQQLMKCIPRINEAEETTLNRPDVCISFFGMGRGKGTIIILIIYLQTPVIIKEITFWAPKANWLYLYT